LIAGNGESDPGIVARCVIVDDSERFLSVAQGLLARGGMDVVATATTQREALERVGEMRPDVVLVDVHLGIESGFDVTRRLVESFPDLHSHVVLISTDDQEDLADLIAASPAVGFLPKAHLSARAVRKLVD
jgi:CheY-like chemotaxis protein